MAYLADFEEDVFISYATIDDEPLFGEPGWVTQLHQNLTARVKQRLGANNVRLWRDIEIRDNDDFTKKIMGRLSKTAALLSVLSPGFLNREWTIRELEVFVQHAQRGGVGLLVNQEKSRIFKVEKLEVPRAALPSAMQGTKSYKFFEEDPEQPRMKREFWPQLNKDRYFKALDDLAYDIANLLRDMQEQPAAAPNRLAVYVAETTSDLENQAGAVRRELTERGYAVLPEGDLSRRGSEYIDQVRENLRLAVMSVHLVGAKYGLIPEGEARSIVRIQHDLAMERGADRSFVRLIWMPAELTLAEDSQRSFIEYLRDDPDVQNRAEIMESKLEDLKTVMRDKLAAIAQSRERAPNPANADRATATSGIAPGPATAAAPTEDPPTIYVICDKDDLPLKPLAQLRNYLLDRGYEPLLPTQSSLADPSLTKHLEHLKHCDAFLIFYGPASKSDWLDEKLADYRQYLRGRTPRVLAKAVYVVSADAADRSEVRTNEALVLRGGSNFSAGEMEPFLQQLDAARQTRA